MKKITAQKVISLGFTLIELLIVIALLGALAIGLLATIDPFEQLKKGRDTSTRNTVSEFYNASLRFYSTKSAFPWDVAIPEGSALSVTGMSARIRDLVNAGELKTQFYELVGTTGLAKIFVHSNGTDTVGVCYRPESKSFRQDVNTKYDSAGGTSVGATPCISQSSNGATTCFYCVQ